MSPNQPDDRARWSRADWAWVAAIGAIGLTLRLLHARAFAAHPLGRFLAVDEGAYWTRAGEILAGGWLPARPFYQDPLFPYALAALIRAVGAEVGTLRMALACVGALTPMVLYWAGRRGFGRAEGAAAGLLVAIYRPAIFTDGQLEKEGLAALVAALGLAAVAHATTGRVVWVGLAGWWWGLLGLLRANALLIGPIGTIWAAWVGHCSGPGRRRGWALGLAFAIPFALAIAPAVAMNSYVSRPREWLPPTWQGGANFYAGNGPGATGTYWAPDFVEANPAREGDDFEAEAERLAGRDLTPGEVSRFWLVEGLKRWRDDPAGAVRLLGIKLGLLAHDFEVPDNQDMEFVGVVASPVLTWPLPTFGWLAPFAAVGLMRRPRTRSWWFVATTTAAGLGSTAAFFVVGRYRIPWTPGLALLAGAGLADLARLGLTRRWWPLAWRVGLVAVPVAWLAFRPLADPTPDRWAHSQIGLAVAELSESRLEPAIDALDDARAISPGASGRIAELSAEGPVHDRLSGLIRSRLGLDDPSARDEVGSQVRRARWLRQLPEGRAEARKILDALLSAIPDDRRALRERAAWSLGDPEDRAMAREDLERSARGPDGDPQAAILLALLDGRPDALPDPGPEIRAILGARIGLARSTLGWTRVEKKNVH